MSDGMSDSSGSGVARGWPGISNAEQSELETLKAQLAQSETWLGRVRLHNQQLQLRVEELANAHMNRGHELRESQAQVRELREAAQAFVDKMKLIHADERFRSVWTVSHIHIGPYSGPTYVKEMEALEAALRSAPPSGPDLTSSPGSPNAATLSSGNVIQEPEPVKGEYSPAPTQALFDKTDDWEERKDLARQVLPGDAEKNDRASRRDSESDESNPVPDGPQDSPSRSNVFEFKRDKLALLIESVYGHDVAEITKRYYEMWPEERQIHNDSIIASSPSRSEWISVEEFFQIGDWFPFHAGVRQNLGEFEKRICIAFAKAYIAQPTAPPFPAREKEKAE